MITSHLLLLLVFAALVSTVFALLLRDEPRDRIRFGLTCFGAFVGSVVVAGWLMYPLPG